jgi:hypothetical protein
MTPLDLLRELCRRYGVSEDFGLRLRPLIERALKSPPDARKRILEMVERSFLQEGSRPAREPPSRLTEADRRILRTVAGILHAWEPPDWLKQWGDAPPSGPGSSGAT